MSARLDSNEERLAFEAYVEALLSAGDEEEVYANLTQLDVPLPYRTRVKVIYSPTSPRRVLEQLCQSSELRRLEGSDGGYVYEAVVGRKKTRRVVVKFFILKFPQKKVSTKVQALVSVCTSEQWMLLRRFVTKVYPRLVPILLSQSELINSAKQLRSNVGHRVHVRNFSAREKINNKHRETRSVREWTDEGLEKALIEIRNRRQVIQSLELEFFPRVGSRTHVRPSVRCKIRKEGEVEVTGSFGLAFSVVATPIAEAGEKKLEFLSGRGMREASYKPRPLSLHFGQPVFEGAEDIREFLSAIRKFPHSMHAIEHGNPYAHLKVTDLFDGSSFEIWAISPDRLSLVPGLTATEAAFERIVHYIFDDFRQGELREHGAA